MIMADVFSIFLVVLSILLGTVSLWVLSSALWPNMSQRSAEICGGGIFKCFLAGIPYSVVGFTSFIVITKNPGPPVMIMCGIILIVFLVYTSVGLSGLATMVGNRLRGVETSAGSPWRSTIFGSLVIAFTCLIPFLGWFFLLSIFFIIGCGARARAGFSPKKAKTSEVKTVPAENSQNEQTSAPAQNSQNEQTSSEAEETSS